MDDDWVDIDGDTMTGDLNFTNISGNAISGSIIRLNGEDVIVNGTNNGANSASIFTGKTGNNLEFAGITGVGAVNVTTDGNIITVSGTDMGEDNTASNAGGDQGWFKVKTGTDLEFRGITAGAHVTLTSGTNTVTVTVDDDWVDITGDTMTGDLNFTNISGNAISGSIIRLNGEDVIVNGTDLSGGGEGIFSAKNGNNLEFLGVTGVGTVNVTSDANNVIVSGSEFQRAHVYSFDTTTQAVALADTFQDITFDTNMKILNWSHTVGLTEFTGSVPGTYEATYTATSNRSGNPTQTLEIRAMLNGVEVSGSQNGITLTSNNARNELSNTFFFDIVADDAFKLQLTGDNSDGEINPITSNADIAPSIRLTIKKI